MGGKDTVDKFYYSLESAGLEAALEYLRQPIKGDNFKSTASDGPGASAPSAAGNICTATNSPRMLQF